MSLSENLERETERTRSDLAHTLHELRGRMTVAQVGAEFWRHFRDGLGPDLARKMGAQVGANPLPAALIGAGIAWMFLGPSAMRVAASTSRAEVPNESNNKTSKVSESKVSEMVESATEAAGEAATNAASAVGQAASSAASAIGETAANAAAAVGDTATAIGDKASSAYRDARESVSQGAASVSETARSIGQQSSDSARWMIDFCVEHPFVLAGAGLAIGAALGSALPLTDAENRLFGETGDQLKRNAEHLAAEQIQKAGSLGERAVEGFAEAVANQFMSTPNGSTTH